MLRFPVTIQPAILPGFETIFTTPKPMSCKSDSRSSLISGSSSPVIAVPEAALIESSTCASDQGRDNTEKSSDRASIFSSNSTSTPFSGYSSSESRSTAAFGAKEASTSSGDQDTSDAEPSEVSPPTFSDSFASTTFEASTASTSSGDQDTPDADSSGVYPSTFSDYFASTTLEASTASTSYV